MKTLRNMAGAAIGAAMVALVLVMPAAADDTGRCVEFGPGRNACTAQAVEKKVTFAQVRVNHWSRGLWSISCEHGSMTHERTGILRRGQQRRIGLGGLNKPTCTLTVRARATNGHTARAKAILLGG